jgi:hypothetical protein
MYVYYNIATIHWIQVVQTMEVYYNIATIKNVQQTFQLRRVQHRNNEAICTRVLEPWLTGLYLGLAVILR